MKKLLTAIFLITCVACSAQSEASNYITYDSTIAVTNVSTTQGGSYPYPWRIRVTRQADYFQRIAADTNNRERINLFMPGQGELQNGNLSHDTALAGLWGFHYFQKLGLFNGAIQLGNGTHFPIYITVIQPAAASSGGNTRPWFTVGMLRSLYNIFHPRGGKFDVAGFSQGSYEWGCALWFSRIAGDHESMNYIESWVDLEGVNPESFSGQSTFDLPQNQVWSTWVNAPYNGRFFGLEGTQDSRNLYAQLVSFMNAGKAGSAYFAYQVIGDSTGPAGTHCCWNSMYNPVVIDWKCIAPISNPVIVANAQNSMGTYFKDPVYGHNIFQWMMRQGDTTLIAAGPIVTYVTQPASLLIAPGEYVTGIIKAGKWYAVSNNTTLTGSNSSGTPGTAIPTQAPNNLKFSLVDAILHGLCALDTTGTIWCHGGNSMGTCGIGNLNANILVPTAVTRDSAGHTMSTMSLVKGSYAGNSAEGVYMVKHGTLSDTLYMAGNTHFGMRGDGYEGDTAAYPVQVWALPSGKRIMQIASEKYTVVRLNDGSVWAWGGGGFGSVTYAYLGYTPTNSATDYLTRRQVSLPDSAVDIAGGDIGGTIVRLKTGALYGWGPFSDYMGNAAATSFNTPTNLSAYINIPGGVKMMCVNSFTWHFLSNNGKIYGCGDNPMGSIGNGDQINLYTLDFPFFVDPSAKRQYMVVSPIQVTNRTDCIGIYALPLFGMGWFAVFSDGVIIYSGRDKGGVAGAGSKEPNANVTQFMPDSYDRKDATQVDPFTVSPVVVYPPYCVFDPTYTYCQGITRKSSTPHAVVGSTQTISGSTATLDGSASNSTNSSIIAHHWYQVTGPVTALVDIVGRAKPIITGMTSGGTYTFRDVVTDDQQRKDSAIQTVIVGAQAPTVSAGPDLNIGQLSSTTITGTATGNGATITTRQWSVLSGPNSPTLTNATTATVTVSGLIPGKYKIRFTATDSNSQSAFSDMTLTVGICNCIQLVYPKPIK